VAQALCSRIGRVLVPVHELTPLPLKMLPDFLGGFVEQAASPLPIHSVLSSSCRSVQVRRFLMLVDPT